MRRWAQGLRGAHRRATPLLAAWLVLPGLAAPAQAQVKIEYYHLDPIGSVRLVTDSAGAEVARYDYHPFGEEVPPVTTGQPRRYAGKERDAETSYDYFGGRYYAGRLGRFTTVDPVTNADAATLEPQRWNRYAYVLNNPYRYADPDGRDVVPMNAQALSFIRSTVPASLRSSIAVGQNGLIDKARMNSVKTSDANFLDLRQLVNARGLVEVTTTSSAKPGLFYYKSADSIRAEVAKLGLPADVVNSITGADSFLGYTDVGATKITVSLSNRTGQASSAPVSEMAVTTAHELYGHALMATQGRESRHNMTNAGGSVDRQIGAIEQRTRSLYEKK